jgi:hypothetical protein
MGRMGTQTGHRSMIALHIQNATRTIGKSQGYFGLPVLDTTLADGTPCMVTAWDCTNAERAAIAAGATIYLTILGQAHPPVILTTGPAPDKTEVTA